MNKRSTGSFLVIYAIALVGCVGLGLSLVAFVTNGGYHPERYLGGLDPVRAGMVVLFLAGGVLFAMFLAGSVLGWRKEPGLRPISATLFAGGMVIACAAVGVLLLSMPPSASRIVMPPAIAVAARMGLALAIVGLVLGIVASAWDRIRGHP